MTASGVPARRAALYLCDQVTLNGKLMAELLAEGALDKLPGDERARSQRLATQVLRHLGRIDKVLSPFLQKRPGGTVMAILRLGAFELCQGGAPHGVVNDWVEICNRGARTRALKGLVNAVLRKVAAQGPALWDQAGTSAMPRWLRDPLRQAWGGAAIAAMERAHEAGAPLDISLRGAPGDPGPQDWAKVLGARVLPTGSLRIDAPGQITALPGYDTGAWWVQDAAAALPARILAAHPGETVLDLCAAPGGKTLQLAAAGADVTAVDISPARLARLDANLARTGLAARVVTSDVTSLDQMQVDAILLDAPCSATGTLRRHPDLPFAKDGSEFAALIQMQADMIDHALVLLRPGGRMVFCTCSLLPDEGEVQIEDALDRHQGLSVQADALRLPGIDAEWLTSEGGLRLRPDYWPDLGGMDGFYIACLRKQ